MMFLRQFISVRNALPGLWICSTRLLPYSSFHMSSKYYASAAVATAKKEVPEKTAETPFAAPTPDGKAKVYSEKIRKLVSEIAALSLLEVSDLNDLLKKTLNLPDAPLMQAGMVMAPAASTSSEEDAGEAATTRVKTSYSLKLIKFDDTKKINLIKEIKAVVPDLNLVQAKKFVEALPQVVKADASKEECEKLKEVLTAQGGICVIE